MDLRKKKSSKLVLRSVISILVLFSLHQNADARESRSVIQILDRVTQINPTPEGAGHQIEFGDGSKMTLRPSQTVISELETIPLQDRKKLQLIVGELLHNSIDIYKEDQSLARGTRLKTWLYFLYEPTVLSTIRSWERIKKMFAESKDKLTSEVGIECVVKMEGQMGQGRVSINKSRVVVLRFGFSIVEKAFLVKTGFRTEDLHSGFAANLGVKFELKAYRSLTESRTPASVIPTQSQTEMSGVTWNPPMPPLLFLGAVADIGTHHQAFGIAFTQYNLSEWVGSSVMNTLAKYQEKVAVRKVSVDLRAGLSNLRDKWNRNWSQKPFCEALFVAATI